MANTQPPKAQPQPPAASDPKQPAAEPSASAGPAAQAQEPGPKAAERFIPAAESRFATSAEFVSPLASYVPEAGTPPEHLLRPEYWANIKALKPRVRLWVEEEAGAYVGELYVLRVGQGYASVCWLPGYPAALPGAAAGPPQADGYEIQYRGHIVKHRVVRLKDGQVLKQGCDTHEDAAAWLRDHKRMLAA